MGASHSAHHQGCPASGRLPLLHLPEEVLQQHIMPLLDDAADRAALASASRALRRACSASVRSLRLSAAQAADAVLLAHPGRLLPFAGVTELRLEVDSGNNGFRLCRDLLIAAAGQLPRLSHLHLDTRQAGCSSSQPADGQPRLPDGAYDDAAGLLQTVAEHMPGLTALTWQGRQLAQGHAAALGRMLWLRALRVRVRDAMQPGVMARLASLAHGSSSSRSSSSSNSGKVGNSDGSSNGSSNGSSDGSSWQGGLACFHLTVGSPEHAAASRPRGVLQRSACPADVAALAQLLTSCQDVALHHHWEATHALLGPAIVMAAAAAEVDQGAIGGGSGSGGGGGGGAGQQLHLQLASVDLAVEAMAAAAAAAAAARGPQPEPTPLRLQRLAVTVPASHAADWWAGLMRLSSLLHLSVVWPRDAAAPQLRQLSALRCLQELSLGGVRLTAAQAGQLAGSCGARLVALEVGRIDGLTLPQRAVAEAAEQLAASAGGGIAAAFAIGALDAAFDDAHADAGGAGGGGGAGGSGGWAVYAGTAGEPAGGSTLGQAGPGGLWEAQLPVLERLTVGEVSGDVLAALPLWAPRLRALEVRGKLLPSCHACHGAHLMAAFGGVLGYVGAAAAIGGTPGRMPCWGPALQAIAGCRQLEVLRLPTLAVGRGCSLSGRAMRAVGQLPRLRGLGLDAAAVQLPEGRAACCECAGGSRGGGGSWGATPAEFSLLERAASAPASMACGEGCSRSGGSDGSSSGQPCAECSMPQRPAAEFGAYLAAGHPAGPQGGGSNQQGTAALHRSLSWTGWLLGSSAPQQAACSDSSWLVAALQVQGAFTHLRELRLPVGSRGGGGAGGGDSGVLAAAQQLPGGLGQLLGACKGLRRLSLPARGDGRAADGALLAAAASAAVQLPALEGVVVELPPRRRQQQQQPSLTRAQLAVWSRRTEADCGRYVCLEVREME